MTYSRDDLDRLYRDSSIEIGKEPWTAAAGAIYDAWPAISADLARLEAENERLRSVTCVKVPTDTMEQEIQAHIRRATDRLEAVNERLRARVAELERVARDYLDEYDSTLRLALDAGDADETLPECPKITALRAALNPANTDGAVASATPSTVARKHVDTSEAEAGLVEDVQSLAKPDPVGGRPATLNPTEEKP